jgi:hypothetical protein
MRAADTFAQFRRAATSGPREPTEADLRARANAELIAGAITKLVEDDPSQFDRAVWTMAAGLLANLAQRDGLCVPPFTECPPVREAIKRLVEWNVIAEAAAVEVIPATDPEHVYERNRPYPAWRVLDGEAAVLASLHVASKLRTLLA